MSLTIFDSSTCYKRSKNCSCIINKYTECSTTSWYWSRIGVVIAVLLYWLCFLLLYSGDWVLFVLSAIVSLAVVKCVSIIHVLWLNCVVCMYLILLLQYSISICNPLEMPWITYCTVWLLWVRHAHQHLVCGTALSETCTPASCLWYCFEWDMHTIVLFVLLLWHCRCSCTKVL
jgi:hypothetical protein